MAKIDRPEAARRLARAIASDLREYNLQKVTDGIANDDLFEQMKDEIQEGLDLYESRVSEEVRSETNFFYRALIDILVKSSGHIESEIW